MTQGRLVAEAPDMNVFYRIAGDAISMHIALPEQESLAQRNREKTERDDGTEAGEHDRDRNVRRSIPARIPEKPSDELCRPRPVMLLCPIHVFDHENLPNERDLSLSLFFKTIK